MNNLNDWPYYLINDNPKWDNPLWNRIDDDSINYVSDNQIQANVLNNINANPYISKSDKQTIKIEVSQGIVSLSGTVQTKRSKPLAYADAFWVHGVKDVECNIKILASHF